MSPRPNPFIPVRGCRYSENAKAVQQTNERHAIKKPSNDADLPVPPHVAFVQYDGNAVSRRPRPLLCGEIPYLKKHPSSEIRNTPFLLSSPPTPTSAATACTHGFHAENKSESQNKWPWMDGWLIHLNHLFPLSPPSILSSSSSSSSSTSSLLCIRACDMI
jgi:hypothetical protein